MHLPKIAVVAPIDLARQIPSGGILTYLINFLSLYPGDLICFDGTTNRDELLRERIINIGAKKIKSIPIIYFKKNYKVPLRLQSLFFYYFRKKIIKYHSDKFELLYIHSHETVLPFLNKDYEIVFHLHGDNNPMAISEYPFFRNKIFEYFFEKLITQVALINSNVVVAINEDSMKHALQFNKNIIFFPNLINTKVFKPMPLDVCRKKVGLDFDEKIILSIGRLNFIKGFDFLINVFREVYKTLPNSKLIIIGEGEEYIRLKKFTANAGLNKSVIFMGSVSYDLMPYYYGSADIFALASYKEGTPMVLLEAIATGIPIVCSEAAVFDKEILNHNEVLSINHDTNKWKDAILDNITSRKAPRKVKLNKFDINYFIKELNRFL